ncbi:MAG: transposase, partial [Clostridiales bacterium]|nr:transposase [Clostridiales bacterium]
MITDKNMPALHAFFCLMCGLAKNLHNAALFRLRNHFTAKRKENLTGNEKEVESEVAALIDAGVGAPKAVISYTKLEKLMRVAKNPDFFAGLPMQSAQWVVKKAAGDMFNWLKAVKQYNKHPDLFSGHPQMPKYKKGRLDNLVFTNQDAVVYQADNGRSYL